MSHQNFKNLLQELCQREGLSLPYYTDKRSKRSDQRWYSTVTLKDWYDQIQIITSQEHSSKIDAQQEVAKILYESLVKDDLTIVDKRGARTALLIDLENMCHFADNLPRSILKNRDINIYVFLSKTHHNVEKSYRGMEKIIVPASGKDASDVAMIMYSTIFLKERRYERYIIVTRDHFGTVLVDLIKAKGMSWERAKAKQITTYGELKELLDRWEK